MLNEIVEICTRALRAAGYQEPWKRSVEVQIRDDRTFLGIPCFFKQVSAVRPRDDMIPEDLRIREYPA